MQLYRDRSGDTQLYQPSQQSSYLGLILSDSLGIGHSSSGWALTHVRTERASVSACAVVSVSRSLVPRGRAPALSRDSCVGGSGWGDGDVATRVDRRRVRDRPTDGRPGLDRARRGSDGRAASERPREGQRVGGHGWRQATRGTQAFDSFGLPGLPVVPRSRGQDLILIHPPSPSECECSLQPSPPGCFTKKLSEARPRNGIGPVRHTQPRPR